MAAAAADGAPGGKGAMVRRVIGLVLITALMLLSACGFRTAVDPGPPTLATPSLDVAIDQFVTTDPGPWINTRAGW